MKIKNIITGFCCSLLLLTPACNDELDYNEIVSYNKADVFGSFDKTMQFVTNVYSYLDYDFGNYYGGAMLASASDESEFAWSYSSIHDFYNGSWSPLNSKTIGWTSHYAAIRAVNMYLVESKGQTFEPFKHNKDYNEQMTRFGRYQYEMRFIRAYLYFNLVREYGDVPLILDVLDEDQANTLSRDPYQKVIDFIVEECDAIVDELPVVHSSPYNESGRVGRIAVLALKARTLLYDASPLFNTSADKTKWKAAAEANKAVIDACSENSKTLGAYTDLWGTENYNAKEIIFARRIGSLSSLEQYNFPIGVEGGNSGNCPTQTLVDAYEMQSTGKAWDEAGSGYNPDSPYNDRDPRLGMTIVKNGDKGWPAYNPLPIQTYEGGANAAPLTGATPTGYYLKKYCDASVDLRTGTSNTKRHSWVTYRLGEFYLNYAEAVFNYLGSADATDGTLTISARDAVNTIRKRTGVNMPEFPAGLSNAEFEKKYMNERMVELAFEGHRFWDIRRWKKGELLKSITRMKITKDSGDRLTFARVIKNRSWNDKMYFFPIPDAEIRKNSNLTQNSGW